MAYTWNGMKKITKSEALERWDSDRSVFLLYDDDTEGAASDRESIELHQDEFGYELDEEPDVPEKMVLEVFEKCDTEEGTGVRCVHYNTKEKGLLEALMDYNKNFDSDNILFSDDDFEGECLDSVVVEARFVYYWFNQEGLA